MNPSLALGLTVHQVLEALSVVKSEERLKQPLLENYEKAWEKISGEQGGFNSEEEELAYKNRGAIMINRVLFHPGPIEQKAVKLTSPDNLPPRFYLSEDEGIILCGKVDWLEYIPENNSVHIIDFKTGKNEEDEDSLQLPMYALLVKNCQNRPVSKMSYWYLESDNAPKEMKLPDLEKSREKILSIARDIRKAREKGNMVCSKGGCYACRGLEQIVAGKAKFVRTEDYYDIFILPAQETGAKYAKEDVVPF